MDLGFEAVIKYPVVFTIGLAVTYLLTPLVTRLAVTLGVVDLPDPRRVHLRPTPRGGGVAVFAGFHVACAALFLLPWQPFVGFLDISWWRMFLLASGTLLVVGVADDVWGLKPVMKLAGQVAAALIVVGAGWSFRLLLGYDLPVWLDAVLTVGWILFFINAFNLIDGLDGLSTGLGVIAALGIAGALLFRKLPGDTLVLLALIGACVAFLRFNFHPASIFLGDSGSMFIGLTLATVALGTGSKGTALASVGVPLLAAGVPLFDVMLAVWRRSMRRGNVGTASSAGSILRADMDHLHHRLLAEGLGQRRVATRLYVFNALLVVLALLSLFYATLAVAIFLLAFAAGSYVFVRHLARVELWDSGVRILSGLQRPPRRAIAVLAYPVLDTVVLSVAFGIAQAVFMQGFVFHGWKDAWIESLPVWVGIPFLFMFILRIYRRVWSRARLADYVILMWAFLTGVLASLLIDSCLTGCELRADLRVAILYGGLAFPGLVAIRCFTVFVHDAVTLMDKLHSLGDKRRCRVLLYGAGNRCTQYLRLRRYTVPNGQDDRVVSGIIDDDTNLHGRLVYSYPVLGGGDELESIVRVHGVTEIVLVTDLPSGRLRQVCDVAGRKGLRVTEWVMQHRAIQDPPAVTLKDLAR